MRLKAARRASTRPAAWSAITAREHAKTVFDLLSLSGNSASKSVEAKFFSCELHRFVTLVQPSSSRDHHFSLDFIFH
jgi:hypothetical protein